MPLFIVILLALAPAAHAVGSSPPEPVGIGGLLQVILALVVVLLAIGVFAVVMRRFGAGQGGAAGAIRFIAGVSVGQRERIVLVQVGETQLLLGVAPGRVQTLHVLDKPVPTEGGPSSSEGFAERLASALGKKGPRP